MEVLVVSDMYLPTVPEATPLRLPLQDLGLPIGIVSMRSVRHGYRLLGVIASAVALLAREARSALTPKDSRKRRQAQIYVPDLLLRGPLLFF